MSETPKRQARRKQVEERFKRYCEKKKANIAANSPSRRQWYPFTTPIPEPTPSRPRAKKGAT